MLWSAVRCGARQHSYKFLAPCYVECGGRQVPSRASLLLSTAIFFFFFFFGAFASVGLEVHEFRQAPAYRVSIYSHMDLHFVGDAWSGFEPGTALQQSGMLSSRPCLTPSTAILPHRSGQIPETAALYYRSARYRER